MLLLLLLVAIVFDQMRLGREPRMLHKHTHMLQVSFGPNLEAETEVKVQFSGEELYGKVSFFARQLSAGGGGPRRRSVPTVI